VTTVRRPRLAPLLYTLVTGWLVAITVLVAHEPKQGAPTPARLAFEYEHALRNHDTDELRRDAPGVPVPSCRHPQATPVTAAGTTWIEVDDDTGRTCARLPTARTHGWWIVR
jgi:hypothetical protein